MKKRPAFSFTLLPLALASVLLTIPVYAGDDDDEGRAPIDDLFKSELVFPQSQGEIQLGAFPTDRDGPDGSPFELPLGIEYGITDSLQLEVEWNS